MEADNENDDLLQLISYDYSTDDIVQVTTRATSPRAEIDLENGGTRDEDETTVTRQTFNVAGDLLKSYVRITDLQDPDTDATDADYELRQNNIYFAPGLLSVATDGSGNKTVYDYATGSGTPLASTIRKPGQNVLYKYDSAGNRIEQRVHNQVQYKKPNTNVVNDFEDVITWKYDDLGRLIEEKSKIDTASGVVDVLRVWKHEGASTTYTDRNGVSTTETFDQASGMEPARRVSKASTTDANVTTVTYSSYLRFNLDGSLKEAVDAWEDWNGTPADLTAGVDRSSVAYTYDEFGRTDTETSNHTFNGKSAPTTVIDVAAFDDEGDVVPNEPIYHGNGIRKGALITLAGTDIYQQEYRIDDRGRISGIAQTVHATATTNALWKSTVAPDPKAISIQYNSNNTRASLFRKGTAVIDGQAIAATGYAYRDDGNLADLRHFRKTTTAVPNDSESISIARYIYGYNSSGRIGGIYSAYFGGSGATPDFLHSDDSRTGYNSRGEFQVTGPNLGNDLDDNVANTANYQRDSLANITNNGQEIGRLNRLNKDANGNTYLYDKEGRVTQTNSQAVPDSPAVITQRLLTWDHRGLLQTATVETTQVSGEGAPIGGDYFLEYYYDVFGRKVSVQSRESSGGSLQSHTVFVWDGNDLALEVDLTSASPQITRGYFNGPGVNEVLAIDQTYGASSIETVWQFADHLGTVRTVGIHNSGVVGTGAAGADWTLLHRSINHVGEVVDFAGKNTDELGATSSIALQAAPTIFAGHHFDGGLDLYDMRARWYDPESQRFLSEDPLGDAGGSINLYIYAGGDPINNIDPTGQAVETVFDAASLGIGTASLAYNLSEGEYAQAGLDAVGVFADTVALLLPFVPGGAGVAIKASRGAGIAIDSAQAASRIESSVRIANTANNVLQVADFGVNAFQTYDALSRGDALGVFFGGLGTSVRGLQGGLAASRILRNSSILRGAGRVNGAAADSTAAQFARAMQQNPQLRGQICFVAGTPVLTDEHAELFAEPILETDTQASSALDDMLLPAAAVAVGTAGWLASEQRSKKKRRHQKMTEEAAHAAAFEDWNGQYDDFE